MTAQSAPPKGRSSRSVKLAIAAILLIVLAICGLIVASTNHWWQPTPPKPLNVTHTPPASPFTAATPITLDATATGDAAAVDLSYWITEQSSGCNGLITKDTVTVPMLLRAAGGNMYTYTLPASAVTGTSLNYYITATDNSGKRFQTSTYSLAVGNFGWHSDSTEVTVTRHAPQQVELTLDAINSFSGTVAVTVPGPLPPGIEITPTTAQVTPTGTATFEINANGDAQLGVKSEIEVDASYPSDDSCTCSQVTRTTKLILTVVDFWISVSPSSVTVKRGDTAHYTLILKVFDGFIAPDGFKFNIVGLPSGSDATFKYAGYTIDSDKSTVLTYDLAISTSKAQSGSHTFDVVVSAVTTAGNCDPCTITHSEYNIGLQIHVVDC